MATDELAKSLNEKLEYLAGLIAKVWLVKGVEPTKDNDVCFLCPYQSKEWSEEPCADCNLSKILKGADDAKAEVVMACGTYYPTRPTRY